MKVKELIEELSKLDPELQVMICDGIGPREFSNPSESTITENDADNCGDCEGRVGEKICVVYV